MMLYIIYIYTLCDLLAVESMYKYIVDQRKYLLSLHHLHHRHHQVMLVMSMMSMMSMMQDRLPYIYIAMS